jgi:hypothetical protein
MDTDHNVALAERCEQLTKVVAQAGDWVRNNRELVRGEHDGLLAELRRNGRFFERCRVAATRKMCVGVFGPSQAGKSYLISALARDANGKLLADFNGEEHDFISEINPAGGKESTGLVTRFTMTKQTGLPPGFPVRIRLLSETDLVKIFANTYYADCEHKTAPDGQAITQALNELEKKIQPTPQRVSLDEFEELQEYLAKNFASKPRVQELGRSFWPRALEMGPRLALADRARLYSVIWDGVEPFDATFKVLANSLESLGHADIAHCPLSALIPRDKSIIDVATLAGLDKNPLDENIDVVALNGGRASLPRPVVTALTAELTISMNEKPDEYFDHTDLLDFPGYRSREKSDDIRKTLTNEGMLQNLFLRGKVAYLFQRYCQEQELTSLLLCIAPGPQEVKDLPGVINDWVRLSHGETPQWRRGKPISLFFVLTQCDKEFDQKVGDPSVEGRWDIRLQASFLDFFGRQHDWPTDWDGQHKFNNLFLLRNPNFIFDKILNYDANGKEIAVRPEKEDFVEEIKSALLNSTLAAGHFVSPLESWEALMRFNDGGIGLIREKLRPVCNPELKRQQILTSLAERQERLAARFKAYWKSDNKDEQIEQMKLLGQQLARLFAVMIRDQRFGEFLRFLCVQDYDLHSLYYEARRKKLHEESEASGPSAPTASVVGATVDTDELLGSIFGDDFPPPPPAAASPVENAPAPPKDDTEAFAALIESHWFNQLRQISESPNLQSYYGLPEKEFAALVGELIKGAGRLRLRKDMEADMRKAAAFADTDMERIVWKQASLAAAKINAYVDWLGRNPRTATEQQRTILVGERPLTVFAPLPPVVGYPKLHEEMGVLEKLWYRDWLTSLVGCINDNVNIDGDTTINREQNAILGGILKRFALTT